MNAKNYLKQVFRLNEQINASQEELDRLRSLSTAINSPDLSQDRVQSSGQSDKIGNIVAKIVDLENEITSEIDRYIDLQQEIRTRINAVKTDNLKLILQKRYLNFDKWEQIAIDMNLDYRWVLRLHNKALQEFENTP